MRVGCNPVALHALVMVCGWGIADPAVAYTVYVSSEKDNVITVVDGETLERRAQVSVGQRPRGIALSRDNKVLYVCTSDEDHIEVLDLATLKVTHTLPSGPDPELLALGPEGRLLYVANEDDNMVTVVDVESRSKVVEIQVGVEPEGMGISPDGRWLVNTSETTNMAHFIDLQSHAVVANVLVDQRPRVAQFTPDSRQVWVSSEIGGTVAVIDVDRKEIIKKIGFEIPGIRAESIQPVGIRISDDGSRAFVALGPAARVAVIDTASLEVEKYLLVGQRVWNLAFSPDRTRLFTTNGVSNDMSVIDLEKLRVRKSVPVGRLPWGSWSRLENAGPHEKVALQAEGVTFSYGNRPVLQDVSIEVPAGSFCVLLGVNGAGKTTLFSLLTRLFLCRRGRIRILGRDLHADGHRALAGLGVVFQQPTLDLDLTLRQNLRYFCVLQGLDPVLARERIQQALTDIGLSDRGDDKVRQLSGGQRRRLELARALLHRPRLLLADEATVGLDIHSRQAILQQVRAECRERGVGVLWATHLVDEVRGDDRVVVLHRGSVLQQGSAEVLLRETASDTVEQAFNRLTRGDAA